MWKVIAVILLIVLIVFVLFHFGIISFHFGFGGKGEGNEDSNQTESVVPIIVEEKELTIVVEKNLYLIEGKQVDIAEIKRIISEFNGKIQIENNYASLSEWDLLKKELASMNISYVEI